MTEINYNLYPKHNWIFNDYDGFFSLKCIDCGYDVQERLEPIEDSYIIETLSYNEFTAFKGITCNLNEIRKTLLSCEEIMIKKMLE